jgi:2-hydroxychromene-2-carboxylate isomerase
MYRWAEHHGVPLRFPSRFPMMTVTALRMTLQLEGGDRAKLAHAVFRAYWVDDEDINDADVLRAVADAADVDGGALLTGCADPAVKALLHDATEAARVAGVCGAPSFAIDDGAGAPMLFWGQDRFELIERVLGGWRPRADQ